MKVTERLKQIGNLPVEFTDLIPTLCASCHEELDLSMSLTELSCPNPFCPAKLVQRASSAMQLLGVKDFGVSFFTQFFRITGETFLSNVFALNGEKVNEYLTHAYDGDWDDEFNLNTFERNLLKLAGELEKVRKTLTPALYLKALHIPNIQSRADKMLENYSNLDDFYTHLESCYSLQSFTEALGVSDGSETLVKTILDSLSLYSPDVLNYETHFSFYVPVKADVKLKVVCSTAVGAPFTTKQSFYKYIDENFGELIDITWSNSATKSCDVLIWSGADGSGGITNKVEKICQFNRKGSHIPILTAGNFVAILQSCSNGQMIKDTLESLPTVDFCEDNLDY